jgi:hypothetical protein
MSEVHWSNGTNLYSGDKWYTTPDWPEALAITPYGGGLLTLFERPRHNQDVYLSDGVTKNLRSGNQSWGGGQDGPPVMAMIPYTVDGSAGVLTAFYRQRFSDDPNVVLFSPDGRQLFYGNSADFYSGSPNVTAMIPWDGGVLTAFALGGNNGHAYWSPDGKHLWQPPMGELAIQVIHRQLS